MNRAKVTNVDPCPHLLLLHPEHRECSVTTHPDMTLTYDLGPDDLQQPSEVRLALCSCCRAAHSDAAQRIKANKQRREAGCRGAGSVQESL